jgi:ATP-dependent Lhr-like helicase
VGDLDRVLEADAGRPPTPLSSPEIWDDAKLWRDFAESLLNYRLSKFQDLMPDWVEQEVVAGYLLSSKNAMNWCNLPPDRHS